jgi:hypothetical protein
VTTDRAPGIADSLKPARVRKRGRHGKGAAPALL